MGTRRVDIAYESSAMVTMAYRGKGYYNKNGAAGLRSFPSWDRIAIVVSRDGGQICTTSRDEKSRCIYLPGLRCGQRDLLHDLNNSFVLRIFFSRKSNAGAAKCRNARDRLLPSG